MRHLFQAVGEFVVAAVVGGRMLAGLPEPSEPTSRKSVRGFSGRPDAVPLHLHRRVAAVSFVARPARHAHGR